MNSPTVAAAGDGGSGGGGVAVVVIVLISCYTHRHKLVRGHKTGFSSFRYHNIITSKYYY